MNTESQVVLAETVESKEEVGFQPELRTLSDVELAHIGGGGMAADY